MNYLTSNLRLSSIYFCLSSNDVLILSRRADGLQNDDDDDDDVDRRIKIKRKNTSERFQIGCILVLNCKCLGIVYVLLLYCIRLGTR